MMYRVDSATLARRGFHIPAVAVARATRTPSGLRAILALGSLGASYDQIYGILAQDTLSAVNNASFKSGAEFAAGVGNDVMGLCSQLQYFDQVNGSDEACPPDIQQQIAAAAASYDNWLHGQTYVPPPSFTSTGYGQNPAYGFNTPPGYQKNPWTGNVEPIPGWPWSTAGGDVWAQQHPAEVAAYLAQTGQQAPPGVTLAPTDPVTGGGGSTAYTVPPTTPAPVSTSSSPPTGGGSSTVAQNTAVQATLRNLSRPNQPLQPGDAWSLTITGAPNAAVNIAGSQNGVSKGTTPFGSTDASGTKVVSGQMTANEIGSWNETVSVGNGTPAVINFSVVAAPAPAGVTGGGGSTNTGNTQAPGGSTTGGTTGTTSAPAPPAASGIDTNSLLLYGGIAVAAFLLLGGRR